MNLPGVSRDELISWLEHRALVWCEVGDETGVAIQGPLVQYFEFQMKDFVQTMCCLNF